jgi:hypothetical protein
LPRAATRRRQTMPWSRYSRCPTTSRRVPPRRRAICRYAVLDDYRCSAASPDTSDFKCPPLFSHGASPLCLGNDLTTTAPCFRQFPSAVLNRPSQTRVRHQGRPTRKRRGGRLYCHEQRRAGDKRCHGQDTIGAQRVRVGFHPDRERSAGATSNALLPLCCCPSCLGNKLTPAAPCFRQLFC